MGTHSNRVEGKYHKMMNEIGRIIDGGFNPQWPGKPRETGFVLLVFPFGEAPPGSQGRINYLSNGNRPDIITALEEILSRFKGEHPEEKT